MNQHQNPNSQEIKANIESKIENGYAETHVGYHADYQFWNGTEQRGAYAQIAAPYGGTIRIYDRSYSELEVSVLEYLESVNS